MRTIHHQDVAGRGVEWRGGVETIGHAIQWVPVPEYCWSWAGRRPAQIHSSDIVYWAAMSGLITEYPHCQVSVALGHQAPPDMHRASVRTGLGGAGGPGGDGGAGGPGGPGGPSGVGRGRPGPSRTAIRPCPHRLFSFTFISRSPVVLIYYLEAI